MNEIFGLKKALVFIYEAGDWTAGGYSKGRRKGSGPCYSLTAQRY